jgi:signal peptidase I
LGALFKQVREWVTVIVVAVVIAVVVRAFFLQQFYISGPSMEPTMYQDNRVLVDKISYRFREPRIGDVVVFDRITMNGDEVQHDDLIKRVIGTPGDVVEIRDCAVTVNGRELEESYVDPVELSLEDPTSRCRQVEMEPVTVPEDEFFVMGDNRPESFDSRSFGTISRDIIVGRAFAIVWPVDMLKLL